jgi:hypothetical protein
MSEELELSTDEILGAASEPVAGVSRSMDDVTMAELMAPTPLAARPTWMVTRYPVSMDDFKDLKEKAEVPEAEPAEPGVLEAMEDTTTADLDAEEEELEAPEGEEVAGPEAAAPLQCGSFQGPTQTPWLPPDPTLAVGPADVLVGVNTDLVGYSKSGVQNFRWVNMTTLFNPVLPAGATIFDPVLAFDHYEQRWIVVIAARQQSPKGSWLLLGVSQGTDPRGPYWIWRLDATLNGSQPSDNWADYPMLGFDTQCIYISCNMFQFDGFFQYGKLRILHKPELYAGGSVRWYDWWNFNNPDGSPAFTIQPAAHFRGRGGNPSAYLVNSLWPDGDSLTFWTLKNPAAHWRGGSSTWQKDHVPCFSYEFPPDAQQPGTSVRIETNDTRLLNAVYQFTGGTKRLWTTLTSRFMWAGDSEARTVAQWYEIDVGTKSVVQQNRYGVSGKYLYFPAIQTDIHRNAYLVFTRSGDTEFAQARYTGRRVSAPAGDMENSRRIQAGESSYTGGRWGDYLGICRDGGDNARVWMFAEYAGAGNTWATWVACASYS